MAVFGRIMVDNRIGATQGFAVIVTKAVDEDGNSLAAESMYFAHDGSAFTGTSSDLDDCCPPGGT